jgi:aromatic-L-amino-acid decarboxylase
VIRSFGVKGLQEKLRGHLAIAGELKKKIEVHPDFEIMAPVHFNLICFRFHPDHIQDTNELNRINEKLLLSLNQTGKMYISHTKLNGLYTLRIVTAQTSVEQRHADSAWELILEKSKNVI